MSLDAGAQQFWFNGLPVQSLVVTNVADQGGQKYWFQGLPLAWSTDADGGGGLPHCQPFINSSVGSMWCR